MRHLLPILAALCFLAAPAAAQTVKALAYNTTNGQVVYSGTNTLTFTNKTRVSIGADYLDIQPWGLDGTSNWSGVFISLEETKLGGSIEWSIEAGANFGTNASTTRANLGFSTNLNSFWTATNASNARSAVGFGWSALTNSNASSFYAATLNAYTLIQAAVVEDPNTMREDIGLSLPALTNTSNVTMMRALAGSTNTNEPYSGTIQYADHPEGDVYLMTVSNGLILKTELVP